jgi:23S rRNA pseudouridine1911/1915/1917 synthase
MVAQIKAQVPGSLNGARFDVAASALFDGLSRKKVKSVIDRGGAYLNKRRVTLAKKEVRTGDLIELFWDEARSLSERSVKKIPIQILFQNQDFVVINKPAGIPSQATLTTSDETVLHALKLQYSEHFSETELLLVHRLDKDTSGVMLIAKSKTAQQRLEKLFLERSMKKVYQALCFGVPKSVQGVLDWPIRKDPSRPNTYFAVVGGTGRTSRGGQEAKTARTLFQVLKTFPRSRASLIECYPETGRTHQIRVHLQALGVPLLGDKTYATNVVGHPLAQAATRHMLHAVRLSWSEQDGQTFEFEAPFPEDFGACLLLLEKEGASHDL